MHPHPPPPSPLPCAGDSAASTGRGWIPPLRRWKSTALPQALAAPPHPQAPLFANFRSPATRRARHRTRPRCRDRCGPFVIAGGTCSGKSRPKAGPERMGSEREGKNDGYVSIILRADVSLRSLYRDDHTRQTTHLSPRSSRPSPRSPPFDQSESCSARRCAGPRCRRAESASCAKYRSLRASARLRSPRSARRMRGLCTRRCVEGRPGVPLPPPLYPLRCACAACGEQWRWSVLAFDARPAGRWMRRGTRRRWCWFCGRTACSAGLWMGSLRLPLFFFLASASSCMSHHPLSLLSLPTCNHCVCTAYAEFDRFFLLILCLYLES